MKKILIVTNIITFLLVLAVIVFAQWQGGNARKAFDNSQKRVAELEQQVAAAQQEAERQRAMLEECKMEQPEGD